MAMTDVRTNRPPGGLRAWWTGRFGRDLAVEITFLLVLLTLYRLGRYFGRDQVSAAFDHARDVLRVEGFLGMANERWLQGVALDHLSFIRLLNRYYATAHFPVTVIFLVVTYVRAPAVYRHVRAILVSVTAVALVTHIAYPLAPPRMMPGFVDTVAVYGPTIYDKPGVASVANQYAAMPSLHVGWAAIVAYGTFLMWSGPRRWVGAVHAVITSIAVVITANHYWLDGVIAVGMVVVAAAIVRRLVVMDEQRYELVSGATQ